MRAASIGSAPPPWEKIQRMSAQRVNVPPNSRLTIARVVSNGNSIIGEGTSGTVERVDPRREGLVARPFVAVIRHQPEADTAEGVERVIDLPQRRIHVGQ